MKKVYTTGEVAKILGLNINTIIKWFDDGKLKGFKLPESNERRIPAKSLQEFMISNEIPLDFLDKGDFGKYEASDRNYKRTNERKPTAIPAELVLANEKESYAKSAKIVNLSLGGAMVEVLSKGKLILPKSPFYLTLKVFQGDLDGFEEKCDMVHVNNQGSNLAVGLKFQKNAPELTKRIEGYLEAQPA